MFIIINISIVKDKVVLEYINKKGLYVKDVKDKRYLYPSVKNKRRKKHLKRCVDIYTGKMYNIYTGKGNDLPRLTIPYKIKSTKEGVKLYDYNMASKLLYFQDIVDGGLSTPTSITYDIETTSLEPAEGFITSIAWIDNQDGSEHTVLNEGDERKMLKEFIKYLNDNNILSIIGFNSQGFDNPYLSYRLKQNDIKYNVNKSSNIDVMLGANKLFIKGSLASIGKQLDIDEKKLDLGSDNPISLYNEGRYDELLYYNLQDVRATNDIMEALNLIDFYKALWELSWTDFNNLPYNSTLNNDFANKYLWENKLLITKANDKALGRFSGGFNYVINEGE